jgi:adenylate kinase family enzyme
MNPSPVVPTGQANSPRRIVVKGTSGAGKSTFAAELACCLGHTYIELDALYWGPAWSEPTREEFLSRVTAALAAAPTGWVVDGNYDSRLGGTVVDAAEAIVWLDLPLSVKLPRLWRRSTYRARHGVELWNGNRETWRETFAGRNSIFVETLQAHRRHRRRWPARFGNDSRFVRLRSVAEARHWLDRFSCAEHC